MSKFYGWPPAGPGAGDNLTGTELGWWLRQANRINSPPPPKRD